MASLASSIAVHNSGGRAAAERMLLPFIVPERRPPFCPEFFLDYILNASISRHAAGGCRVNDFDGQRSSPAKGGTLNVIVFHCLESEVYFTVVDLILCI